MKVVAKGLVFLSLIVSLSCQTTDSNQTHDFLAQVIPYSLDEVWVATQKVVKHYPLQKISVDEKVILTTNIISNSLWKHPNTEDEINYNGYKYFLKISFIKQEKNKTLIIIKKTIARKASFLSEEQKVKTDFIEENVILYDILRSLKMSYIK